MSLELTAEVTDLRGRHQQLASDVADQGGQVATLRDQLNTRINGVREQITGMATELSRLSEAITGGDDGDDDGRPTPSGIDWWILSREDAELAWSGLWEWLEGYLTPTFLLTREELADCWPRHRVLRDMLSWLWVTHRAAHAETALPTAAGEWHLRYWPQAQDKLTEYTRRLGCGPGRCSIAGTSGDGVPQDNELTRPELWHTAGIDVDLDSRVGKQDTDQAGK